MPRQERHTLGTVEQLEQDRTKLSAIMSMECQWNEKVPRQEGPPSLRSVTPSACGYELDRARPRHDFGHCPLLDIQDFSEVGLSHAAGFGDGLEQFKAG